jgi:hypothetical protein
VTGSRAAACMTERRPITAALALHRLLNHGGHLAAAAAAAAAEQGTQQQVTGYRTAAYFSQSCMLQLVSRGL